MEFIDINSSHRVRKIEIPRLLWRFGLLFAPWVYLNRGATFSTWREAIDIQR
jgi:hypothetical protein